MALDFCTIGRPKTIYNDIPTRIVCKLCDASQKAFRHPFVPIQRQVFSALSQISKHSVSLAEMVIEAEIFPAAVACLRDPDEYVRKNVATLMREVVRHTPEVPRTHPVGSSTHKRHTHTE